MRAAKGSRAGRADSSVVASPPTITVSVPASAPAVPPDSGASRNPAPVAVTRSCWALDTSGSMVEQSTTTWPARKAGSMASITSTTWGELGTHRTTISLDSATPAGDPPVVAPSATALSTGPGLREATVT